MNKSFPTLLAEALSGAGSSVLGVSGPYANPGPAASTATWHPRGGAWFRLDWPASATAVQQAEADAIVQAHDLRPRTRRRLSDLIAALNALTNAQKTAIWNDLTNGDPARWELDAGPYAPALALLHALASLGSLSAADILSLRLRGVALYCQDNPDYLVQPKFDPSIQVAGDEVAGI